MWPFKKRWKLKGTVEALPPVSPVKAVLPPRFGCEHKQKVAKISSEERITKCRDCDEELERIKLSKKVPVSGWQNRTTVHTEGFIEFDPMSNQYLIRDVLITKEQVSDDQACWKCKRPTYHPDCWCGSQGLRPSEVCTTPYRPPKP